MLSGEGNETRAPNDSFLKYIENTFLAIYNVLLALQKCILSGAINWYLSVRPFQGNLRLFEITRNSELFSENFRCNLTYYEGDNFSDSFFHHIFESENFRIPFYLRKIASLSRGVKCEKLNDQMFSVIRWASKIVHGWNSHLEIFCQMKKTTLGKICFSEQIFYRKQSLDAQNCEEQQQV